MITMYHNPRCSKSRECFEILKSSGKLFKVVKYLEAPLSEKTLSSLLVMLNIPILELVRQNETIWKENYKGKAMRDKDILHALIKHPKLIERPLVTNGAKAIIARPPEKVKEIL